MNPKISLLLSVCFIGLWCFGYVVGRHERPAEPLPEVVQQIDWQRSFVHGAMWALKTGGNTDIRKASEADWKLERQAR